MNKWFKYGVLVLCLPILMQARTLNVRGFAHVLLVDDAAQHDIFSSKTKGIEIKQDQEVIDVFARSDAANNGRVNINIHDLNIDHIALYDHAYLSGEQVGLDHLSLSIETDKKVTLTGMIGVDSIIQKGNANTFLSWLEASRLDLAVHSGSMTLLGGVGQLRIKQSGSSFLDAGSLVARDVWLKISDQAHARIKPAYKFFANLFDDAKVEALAKAPIRSVNVLNRAAMMYPSKPKRDFVIDPNEASALEPVLI